MPVGWVVGGGCGGEGRGEGSIFRVGWRDTTSRMEATVRLFHLALPRLDIHLSFSSSAVYHYISHTTSTHPSHNDRHCQRKRPRHPACPWPVSACRPSSLRKKKLGRSRYARSNVRAARCLHQPRCYVRAPSSASDSSSCPAATSPDLFPVSR